MSESAIAKAQAIAAKLAGGSVSDNKRKTRASSEDDETPPPPPPQRTKQEETFSIDTSSSSIDDILENATNSNSGVPPPPPPPPTNSLIPASFYGGSSNTQVASDITAYQSSALALTSSAAQYVEEMLVPNGLVGYVIGRGGENIKSIQSTTGAHVQIQKENEMIDAGKKERLLTFQARDLSSLEMAKSLVKKALNERMAAISGDNQGDRSAAPAGGSQAEKVRAALGMGHKSATIKIPDVDVGLVIGKQGANIKAMQDTTGANIQIPSQVDSDDYMNRTCVITHERQEGADKAKEMIATILETRQNPPGSVLGNNYPGDPSRNSNEISLDVNIPDKDVGMVIGRSGCIIKEIQGKTQTRVQIPKSAEYGQDYRTLTVTGRDRVKCEEACEIITRIISEQSTGFFMKDGMVVIDQPVNPYGAQAFSTQPNYYAQQPVARDYSAEWAAYYAQQAQASAPAPAPAPVAATPAADAYYEAYWQYSGYYGEAAARTFYGAWSPPIGSVNPAAAPARPAQQQQQVQQPQQVQQQQAQQQQQPQGGERRETSQRRVSNLPAWMSAGK